MTKTPRIPGAAAPAADDLDGLEPGGALPAVDPVLVEMAALRAEVARLSRRETGAPLKAPERAMDAQTQEEAAALAQADVAKGQRPRPLLTPDGWYVHPESARGPGSLGNKGA